VCDGYHSAWDGNNHVARFTEDADAARYDIEAICDAARSHRDPDDGVWSAEQWFTPLGSHAAVARELGILPTTTDEELATIAEREAQLNVEGVLEYLERICRTIMSAEET
jgi:hypothetical protein